MEQNLNLETLEIISEPVTKNQKDLKIAVIGLRIFKFFASLKLAIFVLVALMAVFAAGTFVESAFGTETASLLIYQSPWFALILFLLGVNVAAAALDRLPWKKKHTGFVITHLGIILVLIGSFISSKWMVDGQVAIQEGQAEHRITLPEPVLYLYSETENQEWTRPFKKFPFSWTGRKNLSLGWQDQGIPFQIFLLNYYPKAQRHEELVKTGEGPAALKVTLHNSFVNQTEWLLENSSSKGEVQVGPAKIRFAEELLKEIEEKPTEAGYLEFQFSKAAIPLSLKPAIKLPAQFPLEGTDYEVTILRMLKNAKVVNNQLIDEKSSDSNNPAVELLLEGKGFKEKHTVFAKFPDFPTQHGMKPSQAHVRIFYRLPGGGSRGQSHELRFVKGHEGLLYQIQTGLSIKTGKVILGEEILTGWMDLTFRVDEFFPHAQESRKFTLEPNTTKKDDAVSAIRLEIIKEGEKKEAWLGQGVPEKIDFQGKPYALLYGQKRVPLGFRLSLRDFRIEHYPGTNNPASFESDVTLRDDFHATQRDTTISMNKPLIHRGFRIYQSGYSQAEGEPDISIFAVGKDPGVPVKYLGAAVMVMGMIIMFTLKRFSSNAGSLT